MQYNWELSNWPDFTFSTKEIEHFLYDFAQETGEVNALLKSLPEEIRQETLLEMILSEAIKTSEIEGEFLSRKDVMSSIKNNLGLNKTPDIIKDKRASGIADLMIDVRNTFSDVLSKETLRNWHNYLFAGSKHINVGGWREGNNPMQVVSGSLGKEEIHFEAPPSNRVVGEMNAFITWFNETKPRGAKEIKDPLIRAAIAHLYFETIHPFEDGNGRIGRAIAEKAISQTLGRPVMLSLSKIIESNKAAYYQALKAAQRSNEISEWLKYFVDIALQAQLDAKQTIDFTLRKIKVFDLFKEKLNDRQKKVLQKMYSFGLDGFEGGMTAKKYISLTKISKATATRDLHELESLGILVAFGAGRNVHYKIKEF
ncbi:Fic family protein [Pedobacter sp. UBA5917]|jgi:Fic family protein|uniref:Fic family protein n=1 Tax=Pedobacter sp. UBA5917 TaxID=1947061 RepID=UPI0025E394FE|nr:Fic family protein [Pedobacter sp. UBA5917]